MFPPTVLRNIHHLLQAAPGGPGMCLSLRHAATDVMLQYASSARHRSETGPMVDRLGAEGMAKRTIRADGGCLPKF